MSERKPRTDLPGYFKGISRRLELQVDLMTPVIVHSGQMGDNDHTWFADLLRQYLPQKYGVDTGFVVNKNSDQGSAAFLAAAAKPRAQDPHISPQLDILVLDVLHNAPFCAEKTFTVCPVEMVLAAVEVTRDLDAAKLRDDFDKLSRVKHLAVEKAYTQQCALLDWPPVTFAVGLTSSLTLDAIRSVREAVDPYLRPDGVFLLDKAFYRFPYPASNDVITIEEDRLFHFIAALRELIASRPVAEVNLEAYLPSTRHIAVSDQFRSDDQAR